MSELAKTRVFFFKANAPDLKAVEAYLTKRGYEVMAENDFGQALAKIMHFDPAFLFIAWDHPNPRIHAIPRFIAQNSLATIIPFIQSTSRDQLRQLEGSGFTHKIYPPVSGPAIIRAILKIEKESVNSATDTAKAAASVKMTSHIRITSKKKSEDAEAFLQSLAKEPTNVVTQSSSGGSSYEKASVHVQKGNRGDLIKYNKAKLSTLSQKLSQALNAEKIQPALKLSLKDEFQSRIKNQIQDVTQAYLESEILPKIKLEDFATDFYQKLLCLIVQSDSWCGYLLIASQIQINNSDYQIILQNWLQSQFINMNEISENDYFEIQLQNREIDLKSWAKTNSDYMEIIENENSEVLISFFSIDPKYLILELSEAYQMLEVPLDIVPSDQKIQLSLFLHLPDNKKYILYTPAEQILSAQQKRKLQEKNVEKLFTPMDFEKELNKLKAEHYLNETVKNIKKVASV